MDRYDDILTDEETPLDEESETGDESQEPEVPSPETQAIIDREVERRLAERQQQAPDFEALIDRALERRLAAVQPQQPQRTAEPEPEDEEEDLPPDPTYDAAGYKAWQKRERARVAKSVMETIAPQFERLGNTLAQSQLTAAIDRAKPQLERLGMGALANHPQFEAEFGKALLQAPMEGWSDPRNLVAIAAYVGQALPEVPATKEERARDERGRYTDTDAQRQSLQRMSPSGGGNRTTPAAAGIDPEELRLARAVGMSPEEYAAGADPTGRALRELRARQRQRAR